MKTSQSILQREEVLKILGEFLATRGQQYRLETIGCFGSAARNESNPNSDVDIVFQTIPTARLTLFDLVLMRDELMERLERPVDLIQFREQMHVRLRERIRQEAVYV